MSSTTPANASDELTYGVELEFLYAYIRAEGPEEKPDPWTQVKPERKKLLRERNLSQPPVYYFPTARTILFMESGDIVPDEPIAKLVQGTLESVGCRAHLTSVCGMTPTRGTGRQHTWWQKDWAVKQDNSVEKDDAAGFGFASVEVNTPILSALDPSSYEKVELAVNTLKQQHRLSINSTCGLHVHVGLGQAEIPLLTVQKLATILWFGQDFIANLVQPERRHSDYGEAGIWTLSSLSQRPFAEPDASVEYHTWMGDVLGGVIPTSTHLASALSAADRYMKDIWDMDSLRDLTLFKNVFTAERLGFDFSRLVWGSNIANQARSPTFEVRVLEGTLNARTITAWSKLWAGLLQFAHNSNVELFRDFLRKLVRDYLDCGYNHSRYYRGTEMVDERKSVKSTGRFLTELAGVSSVFTLEAAEHLKMKMGLVHFQCCDHSDSLPFNGDPSDSAVDLGLFGTLGDIVPSRCPIHDA